MPIDWVMPMSVGIFIAQVLQDTRPTDKRSTAKAIDALNTADAEIG
jgi:hypothetical protein